MYKSSILGDLCLAWLFFHYLERWMHFLALWSLWKTLEMQCVYIFFCLFVCFFRRKLWPRGSSCVSSVRGAIGVSPTATTAWRIRYSGSRVKNILPPSFLTFPFSSGLPGCVRCPDGSLIPAAGVGSHLLRPCSLHSQSETAEGVAHLCMHERVCRPRQRQPEQR